jgi:hypothetical protein
MANQNQEVMDGTTAPIKRIISESDVVFGVWQDAGEPHGVGLLLLKGAKLLREIVASGEAMPVRTNAISCISYEHAVAAKQVFCQPHHDA